ncbi:MAG: hypothetical protein M3R02_08140 [Chloroflexota bacterium]|nr:hypothetical protein [Chloroflexota bacterium]
MAPMTRRTLAAWLGAVEHHRGQDAWRPLVRWIEDVRPGEEGQRDRDRGAGKAMRTIVQEDLARAREGDLLSLITTSVITDGEGIAEAGGRPWRFVLADDGSGGTRATVTRRETAPWVG